MTSLDATIAHQRRMRHSILSPPFQPLTSGTNAASTLVMRCSATTAHPAWLIALSSKFTSSFSHCLPRLTVSSQEASTTLSVAKRQQTYDFHMSCSSSDQEQGHKCGKNDKLKVNAYMCPNICQCDNLGSMHCQTPSGSSCSDGETTDYCRKGSPYFGCACTHV